MVRLRRRGLRDDIVLEAWREQVTAAAQTPGLARELVQHGDALLPKFASWYGYLCRLPRHTRRILQRRVALSLGGVALLFALGQGPAQAAMIEVDGAACNLADAITAANTDTATGGCPAGNGADILTLEPPGRTVSLTQVNNTGDDGNNGLPVITSDITISGQGGTIERAENAPDFRILAIDRGGELTLDRVTIRRGVDSRASSAPFGFGGGIFGTQFESLTITDSTITENGSDGIASVVSDDALIHVINSTISGNEDFGVLVNYGQGLTVTNSTISGNGLGGISSLNAVPVTVVNSTVSGNTGLGGVTLSGARLTAIGSTISGNTNVYRGGGGITGRAAYNITVINSTISGNTAAGPGGGIETPLFNLHIANSTITGNTSDASGGGVGGGRVDESFTISHSLVSGNIAPGDGHEISIGPPYTSDTDNFNLFGSGGQSGVVGFTPGATDIIPAAGVEVSDILDPNLADNGGPAQTHALVPGSPAIDAGDAACADPSGDPLTTDQRGRARPVDGNGDGVVACDIGAFEVAPPAPASVCDCDDPAAITGGPGADVLRGTPDDDIICGFGGDDKLLGKGGNDCLDGGSGNDRLLGGRGNDVITGQGGIDNIHGGKGDDILRGDDGDDIVRGGPGNDVIRGNDGRDTLLGGAGDDELRGGHGDDVVFGGAGDDDLRGGGGDDICIGGAGTDTAMACQETFGVP